MQPTTQPDVVTPSLRARATEIVSMSLDPTSNCSQSSWGSFAFLCILLMTLNDIIIANWQHRNLRVN